MNTIGQLRKMRTIIAALAAVAVFSPAVWAATREYTRMVLDDPTGLFNLRDINNHNQGTGGDIFWQDGVVTHLGSLSGPGHFSRGIAVSDAGHVVGLSLEYAHGFLVTPEDISGDGVPDLWRRDSDGNGVNDLMTDVGAFNPLDVNKFGQVSGWSDVRGFVWHNGVLTDLGPNINLATAINDKGQVVGAHRDGAFLINPEDSDADGVPDRWYRDTDSNGVNDLMTLIAGGWGVDINEHGQVLVSANDYALLWTPTTPNGTSGSYVFLSDYTLTPVALNNFGQAIASVPGELGNSGVLWENGAFVDMTFNPPWPPSEGFGEFYAINDAGWIVADHGNLLIPTAIPEPGALTLSMLAAPVLTRRRKRRS